MHHAPECGMSVLISARGDRLATAPADWLKRFEVGGQAAALLGPVRLPGRLLRCRHFLGRYLAVDSSPAQARRALVRPQLPHGCTLDLTRRRDRTFDHDLRRPCSMPRIQTSAWPATGTCGGAPPSAGGNSEFPMFDVLFLTAHAVYVLGLLSTWRYLQLLAQRVPDEALSSDWKKLTRYWITTVIGPGLVQLRRLPARSPEYRPRWLILLHPPDHLRFSFCGCTVLVVVGDVEGRQEAGGGVGWDLKSRKTEKQESRK